MRRFIRYLGLLLLAVAVAIIVANLFQDGWLSPSIAEVWASIDANSLVGFGSLVENEIDPDLWVDSILPLLGLPVWSLPAFFGVIFVLIGSGGRRRRLSPGG
ncbi:MAG: hypothetical protein AAF563_06960 [Pseudomonadota bacterium]